MQKDKDYKTFGYYLFWAILIFGIIVLVIGMFDGGYNETGGTLDDKMEADFDRAFDRGE